MARSRGREPPSSGQRLRCGPKALVHRDSWPKFELVLMAVSRLRRMAAVPIFIWSRKAADLRRMLQAEKIPLSRFTTCRVMVVLTAESQQLICLVITMGKTSPNFRQRDMTRAVKALEAAGGHVERVEITQNKVILIPGKGAQGDPVIANEPDAIRPYLDVHDKVTVSKVAREALHIETPKIGTADQRRIAAVLIDIGWKRQKQSWDGKRYWTKG
jgi:hypothetical protein